MTLTTPNDNQPDWVKPELGLEEYQEFKLGQKVTLKRYRESVYIIHIQELEDTVFCRGMLPNGASITFPYEFIDKPQRVFNTPQILLKSPLAYIIFKNISTQYDDEDCPSTFTQFLRESLPETIDPEGYGLNIHVRMHDTVMPDGTIKVWFSCSKQLLADHVFEYILHELSTELYIRTEQEQSLHYKEC